MEDRSAMSVSSLLDGPQSSYVALPMPDQSEVVADVQPTDRVGLEPAGLEPAGLEPAGLQPAGLQPAGLQPAGLQPAGLQPAGPIDGQPPGPLQFSQYSPSISPVSSTSGSPPPRPATSTEPETRRHNRSYHTLLTNAKIRHLKKDDGEPLWRVDIQFDFLHAIFTSEDRVFTNSYTDRPGYTFADIYIEAMARSSKSSKILRDKLMGDRPASLNMAMVCLLVNIGRMNTTLNFFPEMKAQLRTYHPIPSLQTYGNQSDYKQLQDAPRLKSILKGACEDRPEPVTFEELHANGRHPHTNPINLIFLLSTYSTRVQMQFFHSGFEFFDLIMNRKLSSRSRARAFLWLVWAYLETDDFTDPTQLRRNPFGPGAQDGTKIPEFERLTPEEMALENVDTDQEKEYGARMTMERRRYNEAVAALAARSAVTTPGAAAPNTTAVTPTAAPAPATAAPEDSDYWPDQTTTFAVPKKTPARSRARKDTATPDSASEESKPGVGRGKFKVTLKPNRKSGKLTSSDIRQLRIQREVDRMVHDKWRRRRRLRLDQGSLQREWARTQGSDSLHDSEDEHQVRLTLKRPKIEVTGYRQAEDHVPPLVDFPGDFGEELEARATTMRRAVRWYKRWSDPAYVPERHQSPEPESNPMRVDNLLDS